MDIGSSYLNPAGLLISGERQLQQDDVWLFWTYGWLYASGVSETKITEFGLLYAVLFQWLLSPNVIGMNKGW